MSSFDPSAAAQTKGAGHAEKKATVYITAECGAALGLVGKTIQMA
jgi:hypothetical protein